MQSRLTCCQRAKLLRRGAEVADLQLLLQQEPAEGLAHPRPSRRATSARLMPSRCRFRGRYENTTSAMGSVP